jgi:hypothetical protein
MVVAAAAAANGSSEKEKRNCEQANERAGSGGGDMSALQIAATQQRVCRGQVSLPETQLGTVSVSADGNSVFFLGGEFLVVAKLAIIHTKLPWFVFWGFLFVAKLAIIHTNLQCFFCAEFFICSQTGDHIHTKHL